MKVERTHETAESDLLIEIAGIVIAVSFAGDHWRPTEGDVYSEFLTDKQPHVMLKAHYGKIPDCELGQKVFDSDGSWCLYKSGGRNVIYVTSRGIEPAVVTVAIFNSDYTSGDIYISDAETPDGSFPYPIGYPLEEVMMINLLSRGRGVLLHACGVALAGRGILFAGTSGTGKSTLANLWRGKEGVIVLSDDRVVVRCIDGRFWMFGTPWHGDAGTASPEGVPLEKVFLIKHSQENCVSPLSTSEAASAIFVRCFPTFWDQSGILYTLGLLGEIGEQVPCYEMGFVPDKSILDFVNGINSRELSH